MIINAAKDGDYRYKWKFIWFPTYFRNGCWVWLHKVYVRQIYLSDGVLYPRWINVILSDPKTGQPLELNKQNLQ